MGKVLSFNKQKQKSISERRQGIERLMFNDILGTYAVIKDEIEEYPVRIHDISPDGTSFELPYHKKAHKTFKIGKSIALKVYFTKTSYILAIVKICHSTEIIGFNRERFIRYGCKFDKSLASFAAIESFIDFLYKFAQFSSIEKKPHS
jgi:hypothetical protein